MAKLKITVVVTSSDETFTNLSQFSHVVGVSEFFKVTTLAELDTIEGITNVVIVKDSYLLEEIAEIKASVTEKGVSVKWQ